MFQPGDLRACGAPAKAGERDETDLVMDGVGSRVIHSRHLHR